MAALCPSPFTLNKTTKNRIPFTCPLYVITECMSPFYKSHRLGNQLGFFSLGLEFHMKFGVTTVLNHQQSNELSTVFDMEKTCNKNLTHPLCVLQPEECQLPGLRKPAKHVSRAWIFKHGVDALKLSNLTDTRIVLPGFPFFIKSIATGWLYSTY